MVVRALGGTTIITLRRVGATVQTNRRWGVLLGCFLLSLGVNGYIIAPSSVAPLLATEFGVAETTVGDAVSATFVGLILTQVPGGYLLDRFDNRAVMIPAALAFVALIVLSQQDWSWTVFLGWRVVGGILVGLVFTGGVNIVGYVISAEWQGVATGLYLTSPPASFVIAHLTGPPVASALGPLRVFVIYGLIVAVGLALFVVGATERIQVGESPTIAAFVGALRNRNVLLVAVSGFSAYALYVFLNAWLPVYGREQLSLSLSEAGIVTAVVPLLGIVARSGGGWLSSRHGGRRRPVLAVGLLAGLVLFLVIPLTGAVPVYFLLVAGAGFTVPLGSGVYFVLTRELATEGTEGASLTVFTTIIFTGSFTAPIGGGWLITRYSWSVAIVVFAGIGLLGTLALLPVSEHAAKG